MDFDRVGLKLADQAKNKLKDGCTEEHEEAIMRAEHLYTYEELGVFATSQIHCPTWCKYRTHL